MVSVKMATFRSILWGLVAVLAGILAVLSYDWYRNDSATRGSSSVFGVPFTLVDGSGAEITEAAFKERPTAIFFGFTHCPDVCPTTLYELDGWLKQADPEGNELNAFMVSVDPERDTPEVIGDYVGAVSDRIRGITGDPAAVADMLAGYRVYARKVPLDADNPDDYTMDHTASVFLLGQDLGFRGTISYGENPETAVQKLKNLIDG